MQASIKLWVFVPSLQRAFSLEHAFFHSQTFVEELVHLPGCFLCYTPAVPDKPPIVGLPALTNGFVTFGSFNNLAKITPEVRGFVV